MRRTLLVLATMIFAVVVLSLNYTSAGTMKPLQVSYKQLTKEAQKQASCLAENIYFEAGHESDTGKLAVAMVTLNRVAAPMFPDTICEVVQQKTNGVCQFSWLCEPETVARRKSITATPLYDHIRKIAIYAMMNYESVHDMTNGALYYHANYVNPQWKMTVSARIGNHIFYKRSKDPQWKKEYTI